MNITKWKRRCLWFGFWGCGLAGLGFVMASPVRHYDWTEIAQMIFAVGAWGIGGFLAGSARR